MTGTNGSADGKNGSIPSKYISLFLLAKNLIDTSQRNRNSGTGTVMTNCPEIFVKKWVDYQTKYGVGYLLSDDTAGVFFNDCTKII
jgi:polo-like kinase 1